MPYTEPGLRKQLGLVRNPTSLSVRESILRVAKVPFPKFPVPTVIDEWFVELGNELPPVSDRYHVELKDTADALANRVHTANAPAVLAIIAPERMAPVCSAADLPGRCKSELRAQLPAFLSRVATSLRDDFDDA